MANEITNNNAGALNPSDDEKLKAAYALNLCTVSLSQIISYGDLYVLEQEYDAILNNLNIQNIIHDETLLVTIKKILETINFFRISEGDKQLIEGDYHNTMKSSIWSAVPSLSVILAGGNPVTAAVAIATQVGVGYMNYRKTKSLNEREKTKEEWEVQRTILENFGALQRELFETAWRLSDKYNFDDSYRLTEKQIKHYTEILMDPDPMRRYERLDVEKHTFQAFPPFWYYKGNAAKEVAAKYEDSADISNGFKAKALEDYRKFNSIYVELMREDVIAASCALEHIALLDKEKDKAEVKTLLDRVMKLAGNNFDVLQIAILNYISLGEKEDAKYILRRLVNENYNVGLNGLLLSRMYCKFDKNKVEYDILQDRIGVGNVIPWVENDSDADKKYIESRETFVNKRFTQFLNLFTAKYKSEFENIIKYKKASGAVGNILNGLSKKNEDLEQVKTDSPAAPSAPAGTSGLLGKFASSISKQISTGLNAVGDTIAKASESIEIFDKFNDSLQKETVWDISINFTEILVEVLNDYLNQMLKLPFFRIVKRQKDQSWKVFFKENSGLVLKNVQEFNQIEERTKKEMSELLKATSFNPLNKEDGNEKNKTLLRAGIKSLRKESDFSLLTKGFNDVLTAEFKISLSVEAMVNLQDNITGIIKNWCEGNGIDTAELYADDLDLAKVEDTLKQEDVFISLTD